jgi:hypothetical protein
LAKLYAQTRGWQKAFEECQAVLQQYPANLGARQVLLDYYIQQGDRGRARAELDRIMALNPADAERMRRWFETKP